MIRVHKASSGGETWLNPARIIKVEPITNAGSAIWVDGIVGALQVTETPNDIDQAMLREDPLQAIASILEEPGGRFS